MLEDMFSNAKVENRHICLRREPLSAAKIVHYRLRLLPNPKPRAAGRNRPLTTAEGHEELFMVLLYHMIVGFFHKEALASAREAGLVDELGRFIES